MFGFHCIIQFISAANLTQPTSTGEKNYENDGNSIYPPPACYANWEPSSIEF